MDDDDDDDEVEVEREASICSAIALLGFSFKDD